MKPRKNSVQMRPCRSGGDPFCERRVGRRAFLAAGLAGGLAVVGWRGLRSRQRPDAAPGQRPVQAMETPAFAVAGPWHTLREVVIPPDELTPSGDDLAG